MSDIDDFFKAVEEGVKELAKRILKGFAKEALDDTKKFLEDTRDDVERWLRLLRAGDLSQDDFEFLMLGRKDLAELHALEQAGLGLVRLDRFKNALFDLLIDTAFGMLD